MMGFNEYRIDDLDLRTVGFVPGHFSESQNIAISGHLDLPQRIGKTHGTWAEHDGLEPYTRPEEIFFAGRTLTVVGHVFGDSRSDLYNKIKTVNAKLDEISGEFTLYSKWGSWTVTIQRFEVVRIIGGKAECKLYFREAQPDLEGEAPSTASGGYGLDGFSWDDLKVIKLKTAGELNRGESKKLETSVFGYEFNRVISHNPIDIALEFFVRRPTYADLVTTIKNFGALVSGPYNRILNLEDGSARECFSKDGMTVRDIRVTSSECYANIDLRLTEIRRYSSYNIMGNQDGFALGDSRGRALIMVN